jgi:CBS domain-containing protein
MTVQANSPAFEALLLMARHHIHHMPVLDGTALAGMITTTDLTEQHSSSAVYLASDIYKQNTLDGLMAISTRVKSLAAKPGCRRCQRLQHRPHRHRHH